MLYPDPKQRTVLGWQIRWIAGLFALLMVAAGAIPAYPAEHPESPLDLRNGYYYSTFEDECATSGELCVATGGMLGAKSGSEIEVEGDDLDSSCLPTGIRLLDRSVPTAHAEFEGDRPPRWSGPGRSAPRAPPLD
ncbi:MAG: hypothetical protein U0900_17370 [Myxococcota bacterium]